MTDETEPAGGLDARRRRIHFRVRRRGMVELDVLLGRFADARLAALSPDDLDRFETLLEVPDQELFRWITEDDVPEGHRSALMSDLIAFHERR